MSQSEKRLYSKHFVNYTHIFSFILQTSNNKKNRKHSASLFLDTKKAFARRNRIWERQKPEFFIRALRSSSLSGHNPNAD